MYSPLLFSGIQVLLAKGAEIGVKDGRGRTPLHIATMYRAPVEALSQLLSQNSSHVNALDDDSHTPLHLLVCTHFYYQLNVKQPLEAEHLLSFSCLAMILFIMSVFGCSYNQVPIWKHGTTYKQLFNHYTSSVNETTSLHCWQ